MRNKNMPKHHHDAYDDEENSQSTFEIIAIIIAINFFLSWIAYRKEYARSETVKIKIPNVWSKASD